MTPRKVDVAAYFEGVYIPINAISVYAEIGRPPSANIVLPYLGRGAEIMLTTIVEVFCRYHDNDTPDTPVVDAYKLLFHGEVASVGISREGIYASYVIRAEAPSQYLNRMPNYFAWAYTREQYSYALQDYEYLGLKYGGGGKDFAMRWFTDNTLLQLANTRKSFGSASNSDWSGFQLEAKNYSPYTAPVLGSMSAAVKADVPDLSYGAYMSRRLINIDLAQFKSPADVGIKDPTGTPRGVGALRANGIRYHQGEDYALESAVPRGAPIFVPYDDCILGICSKEGGSIRFQSPDRKHKIVIYHAIDVQTQYPAGTKMKAGTMLGRVGNIKTSANHLHIELWSDYDSGSGDYYKYDYDFGIASNRITRDLPGNPAGVRSQGVYGIYHAWPDCLMRILGRGRYAGGSIPVTNKEMQYYTLREYMDGLLDALATCINPEDKTGRYYAYYANANRRHQIKDNHVVRDYPADAFAMHYGADIYDSYMNHTYGNMFRYRASMYNYLVSNLATIGYVCYPVLSPLYDKGRNALNEYVATPAFYHHAPPQFNIITIGRGDSVNILDGGHPVTAVKYKSTMNDLSVREFYSPKGIAKTSLRGNYEDAVAEIDNAHEALVAQEKIYGLTRKVDDVSYYYESFLSRATAITGDDTPQGMVQRLCDINRVMSSGNVSSVQAGVAGLNLNPVVGLPALVHCPLLGKDYYGMIQQISHSIDLQSGYCSTTMTLAFSTSRNKVGGISPDSVADRAIDAGLDDFYGEIFYKTPPIEGVSVRSGDEAIMEESEMRHINRDLCSMRDYLTMNKHQSVNSAIDGQTAGIGDSIDIRDIDNLVTTSEGGGASPATTLSSNAEALIRVDKISDLYIKERYYAALAAAREIMAPSRTLIVEGN